MKNIKKIAVVILMGLIASCSSDSDNNNIEGPGENPGPSQQEIILPKEMRAVWLTTVWELDWPQQEYNEIAQKKMYIDYLDEFAKFNINTVFVQVRSMADAFYESKYEPWSKNITGERGKAPNYDVMKFMIEEAHKRGLEFHAWINPYRIATRANQTDAFPPLLMDIDKKMYIDCQKIRVYNPARPEVRERLKNIIEEIITNYDIDGIVMDDYFYPSLESGEKFLDDEDFKELGTPNQTIEQFRFANVNEMVKTIHELIVSKKPELSFTISPQGNAANNQGIYADVEKWCKEGLLDFVMPQLYYQMTDFNNWTSYWSRYSYEAIPMVAYGIYNMGKPNYPAELLDQQFNTIKRYPRYQGASFYSAKYFTTEKVEAVLNIIKKQFNRPALIPHNGREVIPRPNTPRELELVGNTLKWNSGNGNYRFAIYRVEPDLYNAKKVIAELVAITKDKSHEITKPGKYYITAINENNHESELSDPIQKK